MHLAVDFMHKTNVQYVVAVLCSPEHSIASVVELVHQKQIECVDVLTYRPEENYGAYLRHGGPEEGLLPLLFIFSRDEMVLVNDYNGLVAVEESIVC